MNFNLKTVVSSLVVLMCVGMLVAFRSIPVSKIWNSYSIVYVEKSVSENQVLNVLSDNGCEDVIASSLQRVPLVSNFTPVEYADSAEYLSRRNMYFTDQTKLYSLYYVPSKYENNALNAIKELSKISNAKMGMDCVQSYPWLVVCVCAFVYLVFIILSSHKLVFAFSALFPLAFAFSVPEYGVCSSVCLIFMAIFLGQRFFGRKFAVSIVARNFYFDVLLIGAMAILFVNSPKTGFIGLFVLLSCASALVICHEITKYIELKSSFKYEKIITARIMPVMYRKASKVCLFLSVPMVVILCIFFATARFAPKASAQNIAMPAPVSSDMVNAEEKLPVINDFYDWSFNTIVFPYRNLNEYSMKGPLKEGESVSYTRYTQTEQGIISRDEAVYSYDESFKKEMHNYIDNLGYPSVESFLISQGENVSVGYSTNFNAKTTNDGLNMVLIIISMLIPLLLYAVYFVSGKIKYENSK